MDFQPITNLNLGPGGQTLGMAQFGSDQSLYVFFYQKNNLHSVKSREAGLPIYEPVEFVHIQQPGERDYIEREATPQDKQRFAAHYKAFIEGKVGVPDGTPIDFLFPNNPEIAPTLKFLKIFTIQQLAAASADAIQRIGMGGQDWVNKAKQYLSQAENGKEFHALQAQIDKLASAFDNVSRENVALRTRVAQLEQHDLRMNDSRTILPPTVMLPAHGANLRQPPQMLPEMADEPNPFQQGASVNFDPFAPLPPQQQPKYADADAPAGRRPPGRPRKTA